MKKSLALLGISAFLGTALVITTMASARSFSAGGAAGPQQTASLLSQVAASQASAAAVGHTKPAPASPAQPEPPPGRPSRVEPDSLPGSPLFDSPTANLLPEGASIRSHPAEGPKRVENGGLSQIYLHAGYAVVEGYTAAGKKVHLTLSRGGTQVGEARMRSDARGYYIASLIEAGWYADVQPGDVLTLEVEGVSTASISVPGISASVDPLGDTISGQVSGVSLPASLRLNCSGHFYYIMTDPTGNFSLDFSGEVDLLWDSWVQVGFADSEFEWALFYFQPQDGMVADRVQPALSGFSEPMTSILAEVEHAGQVYQQEVQTSWNDGFWQAYFSELGQFSGGDILTATIGGTPVEVTLSTLAAHFDVEKDQVIGSSPSYTEVTVYFYDRQGLTRQSYYQKPISDPSGVFTATFTSPGLNSLNETYAVLHEGYQVDQRIRPRQPYGQVNWPRNRLEGYAQPDQEITLLLLNEWSSVLEAQTVTTSGSDGRFTADFEEAFKPGYYAVFDGGGLDISLELVELTVQADLDADIVSGKSPAWDGLQVVAQGGVFGMQYSGKPDADGSGNYQLDLSGALDLYNGGWSDAGYPQDGDFDQPGWQETALRTPMIGLNQRYNGVWGAVQAPFADVTITLDQGGSLTEMNTSSDGLGTINWVQFEEGTNIEAGDVLTVAIEGWQQSVSAADIQVSVDPLTDEVSGVGPVEDFVEVTVYDSGQSLRVPTDASGNFTADFSTIFDIRNGQEVEVGWYDENWNYLHEVVSLPFARANLAWDALDGRLGTGVTAVYTVTDGIGTYKGGAEGSTNADGWLEGRGCGEKNPGCDMLPGDHVFVEADSGFEAELVLIPIQGAIDVEADTISGQMEDASFPARGEFWCANRPGAEGFGRRFDIQADGSYQIALEGEYDLSVGEECEIWYIDSNGNQVGTMLYTLRLIVNYAHDWVEANTNAGDGVTVEVEGKASLAGTAGSDGWFRTHQHQGDWDPSPPNFEVGDVVTVTTSAGYQAAVSPIGQIDGEMDVSSDQVHGTLNTSFNEPLTVWCEVWVENGPPSVRVEGVDPQGGEFTCDFSGSWDLQKGQDVALTYFQPDGTRVINVIQAPYARANYIWNGVDGWFGAGVTVQFTVTNPVDGVIGGGSGQAKPDGWMDGVNCDCDMQPGDEVEVVSEAGFEAVLVPIPISAELDAEANTLIGQMSAGVFPASGYVEDWNHGRQSGERVQIDIDGDGVYAADFSGKMDVLPGDFLNVWYIDSNGNHVGREYIGLRIETVYADGDGVFVETEPEAGVVIITNSGGGAEFSGQADVNGRLWTGDFGEDWSPAQPDLQPGDTVTVTTPNFQAVIAPLGEIGAELDIEENTVSGTINAPLWSGSRLQVSCNIWEEGGVGVSTSAEADGGEYSCDFDEAGWDLQRGERVAVYYYELDGDSVVRSLIENFDIYLPVVRR